MIFLGLAGMRFDADGLRFQPCIPKGISKVELRNVNYRRMNLEVTIHGSGTKIKDVLVNGERSADGFLPAKQTGRKEIVITLDDE